METLPANSRTYPYSCCRAQFDNFPQHTDDYSSNISMHRPLHVWSAALPSEHTDGCLHAQTSPTLEIQGCCTRQPVPPTWARKPMLQTFTILLDWKWWHWVGKVVAFLHPHVSVFRTFSGHEKIACLTASSNARRDFEMASTSCTSSHNDVVASRIRVCGVPCHSNC